DAVAAYLRRIVRENEDKDAAGVIVDVVVFHKRVDRVLDLYPGHVVVRLGVSHHYVARLSDVQCGIGDPGCDAVLDRHSRATDRIHPVQSGVVYSQVREPAVARIVYYDSVCDVVPKVKAFDREVVAGSKHSVRELLISFEDRTRAVSSGDSAKRDVVEVNVNLFAVDSRLYQTRVSAARATNGGLNRLAAIDRGGLRRSRREFSARASGVVLRDKKPRRIRQVRHDRQSRWDFVGELRKV